MTIRARLPYGALLGALALCGCRSHDAEIVPANPGASASATAQSAPLDHLSPGELAQGSVLAFGFPIPQRMAIERSFPDAVHAAGEVTPEALNAYVRERVSVAAVEVMPNRTIFPAARIRGGKPDRTYRLEVVSEGATTRLVIRDITPAPAVQGLSEAERWRRAGMTPDGRPLNPKQMQ